MEQRACEDIHQGIITLQAMLRKIDRLRLPLALRRDVESIPRAASNQGDGPSPSLATGARTTNRDARSGHSKSAGLSPEALHILKLASLLHDISLLTLPPTLPSGPSPLDSRAYITV